MPGEIYLDSAATAHQDPSVSAAIAEFLGNSPGNASSVHGAGVRAAMAVERARAAVAKAVRASPDEIVFCSGGTEANNLAIQGVAQRVPQGSQFIFSAIEHSSVLEQMPILERLGISCRLAPVTSEGIIDLAALEALITKETRLVSVMQVNNEIGTIQPITELSKLCAGRGILFHSDACQALGKVPVHAHECGADLLSLSAHKIHGPLGVGALVVKAGSTLSPLFKGGSHEKGIRPGTLNAPGIVGFGRAVELLSAEESARIAALRDELWSLASARISGLKLNGSRERRSCNNLNVTIPGAIAGELASFLDRKGAMVSTGSACHSNRRKPSHVLTALDPGGAPRDGLRISLSRFTTADEVIRFADLLQEAAAK